MTRSSENLIVTLIKLTAICCFVLVAVSMNLFGSTSLNGDPMFLGMAYGLADTSAAIMSGFVLKYVKDSNAFIVSYLIAICGMVTFYYSTKAGKSSLLS
jgi:hypothetical protein